MAFTKNKEIDAYISAFPLPARKKLKELRSIIISTAPKAEEIISYKMPAYKYWGMLIYFAGYKSHIGFYPGASGIANFQTEISKYKNAKGSVQFPLDKPLPIGLIKKILHFRLKENKERFELKKKK